MGLTASQKWNDLAYACAFCYYTNSYNFLASKNKESSIG